MIKKLLLLSLSFLVIFGIVAPGEIYAANKERDEEYYTRVAPYYEPTIVCVDTATAAESQQTGKVYFVGDSILAGTQDAIKTKLLKQGSDESKIVFNSEVSRSVNNKGQPDGKSGLQAIEDDSETIKAANTVVVELGTNLGLTKDDIKKVVKTIKETNKRTSIYWVNIGTTRDDLNDLQKNGNRLLDDNSKDLGYTVIDWSQEVKDSQKQSQEVLSDGVHPNEMGTKLFANIVTKSLKNSTSQPLGTFDLNVDFDAKTKDGRAEKIWAYLTSPAGLGLTSVQAAGAMGNMEQENSQFDPRVRQNSEPKPEIIVDGLHGYGIIQWTSSGRQQGLKDHAEKIGKSSGSLDAQLSYIKHELNNGYKNTLEELKKVKDDPVEAAFIWHGAGNFSINSHLTPRPGFEASGDSESAVRNVRGGNAKKWLTKLGDKILPYVETSEGCKPVINESDLGVNGSKDYTDSLESIPKGEEVAQQAINWTKNDPDCGFHGGKCLNQCLGIVSDLWTSQGKGIVSGYDAWEAYKRYKLNGWVTRSKEIPVGAIMWSANTGNPGNGHAYTYIGNGLIASNDIKTPGKYSIAPAADIEKKWGHTFLGWSKWHG